MKQGDSLFLRHILDAIARIEQHVQGLNREGFGEKKRLTRSRADEDCLAVPNV